MWARVTMPVPASRVVFDARMSGLGVECSLCGHLNREGARFCARCAAPLLRPVVCSSCGADNLVAARYCDRCGVALSEVGAGAGAGRPTHTSERLADAIASAGERKLVTVLFADVVDSMGLAARSDPEDWREIIDRFFTVLCEGVRRFEGTVDKFTGDGVMALFGAPIAHEDHARRACIAALHLQRELAAFAAEVRRAHGLSVSVRVGLDSGEVVVGAIGEERGGEYTALGHTVGLAQRVEESAEPGKVYVSERTASLADGYVGLVDLGEFRFKGAEGPQRIFELTGVRGGGGRFDVVTGEGLSRFVGRDQELDLLEGALAQALGGRGQLIGIVGDAGVGKSRLCHELGEHCKARGIPVYHVVGQAHAKSVPLLPVLQFLRAYFQIGERDSDRTARERIAGKLLLLDPAFEGELPLLFDFLAVPDPEHPVERMDPEARQRRLLEVMKRLTRAENARTPGLMVCEDLHWLDDASEVFLANRVDAVEGMPGLMVVNFRPEYHAAWMSRSYYRQLALAPLAPAAVDAMLVEMLGFDPSLADLSALVHDRTQGNPFFVEELIRALVEEGTLVGERGAYRLTAPLTLAAIPASVQAVLAARIDRLAAREKTALQAAAVIGREFSAPILERVAELPPAELEQALHGLVAGEFVYEQQPYPETVYAFKHPLTREVAYRSQLRGRRATVHAAAARAITEHFPERRDERAALIAQHWDAAGEVLQAASWHARAAAWAGFNDPVQALEHWRRVRELTDAVPASAQTSALGLTARIHALNYGWRLGISPEEARALFHDAERLASRLGDLRSLAVLLGTYGHLRGTGEGDVRAYATLLRRALALAAESGDPATYILLGLATYALAFTGDFREAVAVLDRAIELANGDPTVAANISVGCPLAHCHNLKGLMLTRLGELEHARDQLEHGQRLAQQHGAGETVGWSHSMSVYRAYFVGRPNDALAHAQQELVIAERIGDSFSRAHAWLYQGLAQTMRSEWRAATESLQQSMRIAHDRRTTLEMDGLRLSLLAESHLGLGDAERAHALAVEGLDLARARGNLWTETHASLALARVMLRSAGTAARDQIAAALNRALELVHTTSAKAFEPMVHVELAELARQTGDEAARRRELREAHRLFNDIGATGHAERLANEPTIPAS
jgi:class 3 adenylate cyclase/tetratricopeptide (TPR) repeat protein